MDKPEQLKNKGTAMYDSSKDKILVHFNMEDLDNAIEWLKESIDSDVLLKSMMMGESERLLFEKIDAAFYDVTQTKKKEEKE